MQRRNFFEISKLAHESGSPLLDTYRLVFKNESFFYVEVKTYMICVMVIIPVSCVHVLLPTLLIALGVRGHIKSFGKDMRHVASYYFFVFKATIQRFFLRQLVYASFESHGADK